MPKNEPEGKIQKRRLKMRLLKTLKRVTIILSVVLLIFLAGCASSYKDFKVSDVDDDEGIAIGKINVVYNGETYNEECKICISDTCHKLTEEGYVFMPLGQGTAIIEKLYCKDGIEQNQAFQGAQFMVKQGVTYFGDVTFNWKNENQPSFIESAFALGFAGGAFASTYMARLDGEIVMSVEDNIEPVLKVYQQQVGDDSGSVEKSIVTVGVQAEK
jgi:hypothetical protein